MPLEREVKLGAAPGFHLPDLDIPEEGLLAEAPIEQRLETTYYDTEDLRLARWGYSLRHRAGEGWTLKVPAGSDDSGALHRDELNFVGPARTPPPMARALVTGLARGAPLRPVAHLWTRRRKVRISRTGGERVAEVVDDEVSVLDGRRVAARFREVEVELAEATESGVLGALMDRLQAAGAGAPDPVPKHVRALGPRAQLPPEAEPAEVSSTASAGDVVRHAFASAVQSLIRHDPGVRLGDDPEDVHQARVAIRRLRSHLRTFRSLLEPEWSERLRSELSWLGGELGAVRDAEVLHDRLAQRLADLPAADRAAGARVLERLAADVENSRKDLLRALDSERYLALLGLLVTAADRPELLPAAEHPADDVLPGLAGRSWRQLRKQVRALPEDPADTDLHMVRIRAKRARYAADASALVCGKDAERFARAAARVQTVLGEHQDSVTAQGWLRGQALRGRSAFAAGELFAAERTAQARARSQWPKAWKALDQKRLRQWIPSSSSPPPHQIRGADTDGRDDS